EKAGRSGTQSYRYDAEHRMVEVTTVRGTYRYVYDALGRRTEKQHISPDGKPYNRTKFLWDGMRLAQESRPEGTGSLYIYRDPGSYEPLARVDKAGKEGSNRILYFHTDVNGAPEEMTDSDGKIVWETGYQVWSNTIQEKDHGRVEQNLRYQGQYLDRETGLHYNLHRYYDPDVGRFIVTDPIGLAGGINLYAYAPNPLSWIDPLGLSCKPDHGAGKSTKKYGHARSEHGSQRKAQELMDRAKNPRDPGPQGHFSDNRLIEEAFEKAPATPGVWDVKVSKSSNVYYPDGTTKVTDIVRVIISEKKGPVTAYPYVVGD
ncbi:RHS repeat domain-containing protein, partial [Escherichia coli]|uniref:RHS repeat domain-containing protein n=1 Tax=Escherichia coli TaxID=562 RepID=UPI001FCF0CE3